MEVYHYKMQKKF